MFNETSNSSIGTNFTSFQEDDRDWSQLMYIIALGAVLVCGCCVGFYVFYLERQNTKRYVKWVFAKKNGYPMVCNA